MTVATGEYQHGDFKDDMAGGIGIATGMVQKLEVMHASLASDAKAGSAHLDDVRKAQLAGLGVVEAGAAILGEFGPKYDVVVKAAMDLGQDRVAQERTYHTA
jgi:hypothetical protein